MENGKFGGVILICLGLLLSDVNAANILAIFTTATRSHHNWNSPLMVSLANRGHQITIVSPIAFKQPVPNITDIVLEGLIDAQDDYEYNEIMDMNFLESINNVFNWYRTSCEQALKTKGVKTLMELTQNTTFDLYIIEAMGGECLLGFLHMFGAAPIIAVNGFGSPEWINYNIGSPFNPAFMTSSILNYIRPQGFFQRLKNSIVYSVSMLVYYHSYLPANDELARKYVAPDIPPAQEVLKNISVLLVNADMSYNEPTPLVPGMIPVGGIHIKKPKPLPKDIQAYLDDAKDGVIYFSLGSLVRSDKMTTEKRQFFLDAFAELPHKVLWKWESDTMPGQPKNVKVGKWLPQNDILAHPNVRLFISHSGLLSTHEAIYHGVPVVGMPFVVDQFANIKRVVYHGLGEELDYNTLSKEVVLSTIRRVLEDPRYREHMKKKSAEFRDQPLSPLERAVYWVEYVLRHGGARHLRAASLDMPLYQYLLLDVVAFLLGAIGIFLAIMWLTLRTLIRRVSTRSNKLKQQ